MSKIVKFDEKNLPTLSPYWNLEGDVSNGLNRLKAKIFNLLEATLTEVGQRDAVKGLIRGFANDEYRLIVENMRHDAMGAGFLPEEESDMIPPLSATPLESRDLELIN